MKHLTHVAVVIPCYNEAESIGHVIAKFPMKEFRERGYDVSIFVVDNNSSDNTAEVARAAGANVMHEPKKGKGNALRTGFLSLPSNIDYVAMLDGDDTYSPEELLRLIEPLQSEFCDAVIGSRLGGKIKSEAMAKLNLLGNRFFTTGVRLAYHANVTDVLTGYFAWKKPVLDELTKHITSQGFAIEMEMITKMAKLGFCLTSVPISYHPRLGDSNLHPLKDGSRILKMLFKNLFWKAEAGSISNSNQNRARRIVFVSDAVYPYMKGGKEKRLYEIAKRLATLGYDVHIYTMHWWRQRDKTIEQDGIKLHAICKKYPLYNGNKRTIKEGLLFALACFKLFRVPFDVLDVDHMPFFPVLTAWIVCKLRRRRLFATWHEALSVQEWKNYMGIGGIVASVIERICIRLPHRITAASEHTQELLASLHGRRKGVDLVASGVDMASIEAARPSSDRCDVLYVGRLVKDKHVDKLIQAVDVVRRTAPDVRCYIIGTGPEKKRLQGQITSLGLQENIRMLGMLPEANDIYSYMKTAKVFCSPSVREGFGITTLEALACGTPVITINSPSNAARHLIHEGKNGSIVTLSSQALAAAVLQWMDSDHKLTEEVKHVIDWQHLALRQAEIYSI